MDTFLTGGFILGAVIVSASAPVRGLICNVTKKWPLGITCIAPICFFFGFFLSFRWYTRPIDSRGKEVDREANFSYAPIRMEYRTYQSLGMPTIRPTAYYLDQKRR